jgi:hypothetical protein
MRLTSVAGLVPTNSYIPIINPTVVVNLYAYLHIKLLP